MATTKSELQVSRRLDRLVEKQEALEQARKQAGIPKLEAEIDTLKQEITTYMNGADLAQLQGRGHHATLVRGSYDAHFIRTKDEITGEETRKIVPLRTIIYRKFPKEEALKVWQRVTRRVVVKEQVEEAVAEGLLTINEIAQSFVEKQKKPYIRITRDRI